LTSPTTQQQAIHINIADFTITLSTDDSAMASRLRERYADFLDETSQSLVTIQLFVKPGAIFIDPQPGPWIIESSYTPNCLTYRSFLEQGEINWETRQGTLELSPEAHIENFLRVVYAWLALQDGGLLLHAAGLIRDGHGYVFFGPSGAGKTTTTRLSAPTTEILSDDLVILRCHNGQCQLYGVPFRGDFSDAPRANQRAPLRGIFRLHQDKRHYLEPLPRVTAIAELVAASPFVVRDLSLSQQLIAVCQQIAQTVPVQLLHFKRDNGFWKEIDGYYENLSETAPANGR
jgi:hypothetical protein